MSHNKKDDDYRPENLTKWQRFSRFVWNSRTHEFLGRTGKSWFQITIFYIALYGFLAAFFTALLMIFYQTVDISQPKWKLDESLIGSSPGLGYRPMNPNAEITIVSYNSNDEQNVEFWSGVIDSYLETYDDTTDNIECSYGVEINKNVSCKFSVKLTSCKRENSYGFKYNKPCLFFKLNKIYNWKPEPYLKEDIEANTMNMPDSLRNQILTLNETVINSNVWASCTAADPHANVTLTYDGHPGFPMYYYPYLKQNNYHSPLVVMQINDMPIGQLVRIYCQLWAKNIAYDRQLRRGGVTLEIQSKSAPS